MPQTVIKIIKKEYLIIFDGNTINIKYSLSFIMFNSAYDLQKKKKKEKTLVPTLKEFPL